LRSDIGNCEDQLGGRINELRFHELGVDGVSTTEVLNTNEKN